MDTLRPGCKAMTDRAERRERVDEAPTVHLVIEWDAQWPDHDEALVEEIAAMLAGGPLKGYRPTWAASFPQGRR